MALGGSRAEPWPFFTPPAERRAATPGLSGDPGAGVEAGLVPGLEELFQGGVGGADDHVQFHVQVAGMGVAVSEHAFAAPERHP